MIHHARACRAKGTLIVPEWPSAVFWPLICPDEKGFASFVKDFNYLPIVEGLFMESRRGACLFANGIPNTNVVALRLDFMEY